MWYKFSIKNEQPSSSFDAWHEGNLIKDEKGNPKVLYHGTLSPRFEEFDLNKSHPDNVLGKGVYTTDNPDDSGHNYSFESGGDVKRKISEKLEELYNLYFDDEEAQKKLNLDYSNEEELFKQLNNLAVQELKFNAPNTIPLYGKMKNPLIIDPNAARTYSINDSGKLILEKLKNILEQIGYHPSEPGTINKKIESIKNSLGANFNYFDLHMAIKNNLYDCYLFDLSFGDIENALIRSMGHDGAIMNASEIYYGMFKDIDNKPTNHYIFFDPGQVKSPFNKTFNPNDKRINSKSVSWYKLSQAENNDWWIEKILDIKYPNWKNLPDMEEKRIDVINNLNKYKEIYKNQILHSNDNLEEKPQIIEPNNDIKLLPPTNEQQLLPPIHENCRCYIETMPGGRKIWQFADNCCDQCKVLADKYNHIQYTAFGI